MGRGGDLQPRHEEHRSARAEHPPDAGGARAGGRRPATRASSQTLTGHHQVRRGVIPRVAAATTQASTAGPSSRRSVGCRTRRVSPTGSGRDAAGREGPSADSSVDDQRSRRPGCSTHNVTSGLAGQQLLTDPAHLAQLVDTREAPVAVRQSRIRWASTGPTPGRVSSAARSAVLSGDLPPEPRRRCPHHPHRQPSHGAGRCRRGRRGRRERGTRTCSPSTSTRARLTLDRSALDVAPPAASTASPPVSPAAGAHPRPPHLARRHGRRPPRMPPPSPMPPRLALHPPDRRATATGTTWARSPAPRTHRPRPGRPPRSGPSARPGILPPER